MTDVAEPTRASRLGSALEARHSGWSAPLTLWLASRAFSTLLLGSLYAVATA